MQTKTMIETGKKAMPVGFGHQVSEHMLVAHYNNGRWQPPSVLPYGSLSLAPATLALHYGQSVFEGMKAFSLDNGAVSVFRLQKHWERFARSLGRMCMPVVPFEYFRDSILALVGTDADWVPRQPGAALYIRPFVFATDEVFGVKVSQTYSFVVFTGPVGAFYEEPLRVKVETEYIRAAEGGSGYAKCAGNYAAAFYPTQLANRAGYQQLLWTDSKNHEFIEEAGTMNVMFVVDDVLITPALTGTILEGVTRHSLLQIAGDMGVKVQERRISYHELVAAAKQGRWQEAFGVGTAAVVSRIAAVQIDGTDYEPRFGKTPALCDELRQRLQRIQTGAADDVYGWNTILSSTGY